MSNLFASVDLVRRIEAAETRLITSVVNAVGDNGETVLVADVAGGSIAASREGSPFNKLVGAGFGPLDEAALVAAEQRALALSGTVRAEIATLADPGLVRALLARGYRFEGYENVLGRPLADLAPFVPGEIEARPARDDESVAWMDAVAIGFLSPDAVISGVVHETFDREGFDQISRDTALVPSLERWIAFRDGAVAGGGSLRIDDGIAQLCGAATVPAHRRCGVQSTLLRARLDDARRRGCELAVVTTDPGSKSQENAQKAGFSLLYARVVLVLSRGLFGRGGTPRRATCILATSMLPAPRRFLLLAVLTLLASATPACGARSSLVDPDDDDAGRPGNAAGAAKSACDTFAEAYCAKLLACDPLQHGFGVNFGSFSFRDAAQCRERLALSCTETAKLPGVSGFDASARACAEKLNGGQCGDLPRLRPFAWIGLCGFAGGQLATDAPCREPLQCASGSCSGSLDACGQCEATVADGTPCGVDKQARCREGSSCRQGVCTRFPTRGEACASQGPPCLDGFDCDAGICTSFYAPTGPCGGTACSAANGSYCSRGTDCVPLKVAPPDGGCGNVSGASTDVPIMCPAEQGCVGQNDFGSGRCRTKVREAEPCDDFEGPSCLYPAVCVAKRCVLPTTCPSP